MIKRKIFKKIIVFFVSVAVVFVYLLECSTQMIIDYGKAYYASTLTTVAYNSVESAIGGELGYNDLIYVDKTDDGCIAMVSANAYKVNKFATEIALCFVKIFEEYAKKGLYVPIGIFSGIKLLGGFGKKVKIKIINVGNVNVDIISSFTSVGINQTRQQLYAVIKPDVSIITTLRTYKQTDEIKLILYDNLIVGNVPNVYLENQVLGSGRILKND